MAAKLITFDQFGCFKSAKDFPPDNVTNELLNAVRALDEKEELEPFIRQILFDSNSTPHGPAEIADIITHKINVDSHNGIAAFILKGKSFPTVRPKDVSHQIYRLEKIAGLKFAFFVAVGNVLDGAKEQFVSTCGRLNLTYSILDASDIARLFVAHGYFCPRDAKRIVAGRCHCGYSPPKRILNIFQKETLKLLKESRALGQISGLVVLPPGSGKTRISAEDAKVAQASCVLYVAQTYEILDVAKSEFEAVFGAESVKVYKPEDDFSNFARINLISIQLLNNRKDKFVAKNFDYVIIDEFHHAAAKSYRVLINSISPKYLLGLTATPFRGDRQDIVELCGNNIIVNFELRSGINSGLLCPYHYYGCFDDIDYSHIKHQGTRYGIRDLERHLIIPERDNAIIQKWKDLAENLPTLAFCCSHNHAKRVARSFNSVGIPAKIYISDTSQEDRKLLIQKLQSGGLKVICVVDVLNEGADLPFVEALLFLRPTESKRIFYQQIGRGLRRFVGKSHCKVIDFIGNFQNAYKIPEFHGLLPFQEDSVIGGLGTRNAKEILNLPIGCTVNFDDRVIDIFAEQTLHGKHATRHNIGMILVLQYRRLARKLSHNPTKKEVDRNCLLDSSLYQLVFGSWEKFVEIVSEEN